MSLTVPASELDKLHAHAVAGYPHEVVGILAGDRSGGRIHRVHPLVNERADSAHNRYKVSGLTLMRAEAALESEGFEILGYYHSHPNGLARPSATDSALAANDGAIWAIIAVGRITLWRSGDAGFEPLPYEVTPR